MPHTYYIATDGDDAAIGSYDAPLATFDAVSGRLVAGDTVLFKAGTYQNATYGQTDAAGNRDIWKASSDTIIRLNDVHGTKAAPITIKPAPGAEVKLQYDGNGAIVLRDSSHIIVEGFEIEGPATSISLQDAQDAQWSYRIATSQDEDGNPVYEYFERDTSEVLTTKISDIINGYAQDGIDQSGSGKPGMMNAPAISLPAGSHNITIRDNIIHDSAAHAVSGHGGNDYITVTGNEIYNNNRHTSNGTHAISFKALDSLDDNDGVKILVEGNHLYDNFNALVSWVTTKVAVKMEIDEGKSIHIQNAMDVVDAQTGHRWDHGKILIANNLIERAGNAGVTLNDVRGATITHNTIIDAGHVNTLLVQDGDADSDWFGFFRQQGLTSGDTISVGALRLTGADGNTITDNLISLSNANIFAVDAAVETNATTTTTAGNLYVGGKGLRFRSETDAPGALSQGFKAIADAGFVDAQAGNYSLSATSEAVDAGGVGPHVLSDINDAARNVGAADVGAYEYLRGDNDTLTGTDGPDQLLGYGGDDVIWGGKSADLLDGGTGADTMQGGLGNDFYVVDNAGDLVVETAAFSAGGGIDTVRSFVSYTQPNNIELVRLGNITDTTTLSATGNDAPGTLVGNAGDNQLTGRGGNDQINGNNGDDILIGNTGRDTLVGGNGEDTFVYTAYADSRAGAASRDVINGFGRTAGQDDVIDLSDLDANTRTFGVDDAFTFIGGARFSGQAGELRYQGLGGPNAVLVEADHNGDGQADLQILVNLTTFMTGTDFIL